MWGRTIGAVSVEEGSDVAAFQYDSSFLRSGIEIAPMHLPLSSAPYRFPSLNRESFHGLPGLLADSLPDTYGTALINAWLAGQGRSPDSANAVERLCYTGRRGTGALEFEPARGPAPSPSGDIQIAALVKLASQVLSERKQLVTSLSGGQEGQAMRDILSVGTSAGGARAKAIIAWNPDTGAIRSGHLAAGPGFERPTTTSLRPARTPTSRRSWSFAGSDWAPLRWSSSCAERCSTSSRATRTTTSRTSRS